MITDYRPLYPYVLLTVLGLVLALLDAFMPKRRTGWIGWIAAPGHRPPSEEDSTPRASAIR